MAVWDGGWTDDRLFRLGGGSLVGSGILPNLDAVDKLIHLFSESLKVIGDGVGDDLKIALYAPVVVSGKSNRS